ncbi:tRNA N(3)-methylcytidine methyltransferase METTL6 isoform X1 [Bombus impatiens]|uniref:tRNA N(3)-methylcytidine methyltransferase n=1 Tax=Bombus impatiens TaxID=132113 RepID=A0A6P8L152_BOMIM|nr:tRNA N(3)-methylcytidine methyltransferase METTL6 isoform X1 [Bombus impatiens]XP_033175188.1 tRNA N(3)-methylcytidine methyltransferase METTL6 isoform X1 [Bombus impatiens]
MAESVKNSEYVGHVAKKLTQEEIEKMQAQNSRLVSEFRANQLEKDAKKHWDLFYKRNDTRFFKDRHWTTREFHELLGLGTENDQKILLEVGCGVGNFIYPLIEDGLKFKIFACDLSPRAVELAKKHILYNPKNIKIFQTDITTENCFCEVDYSVNIVTLIFVLSAINPTNFRTVVKNLYNVLDIGGIVLFRDYGLYDMAQLRFKPGHKISENLYMRQDGTRTYYFSEEEVLNLFESTGFKVLSCSYVQRRTINLKEKIDVPRIFVQGKFGKFQ